MGRVPEIDDGVVSVSATVDLHAIIGQFVALRHEVNLQTKSSRSTLEQNAATLKQLEEAVAVVRDRPEEPVPDTSPELKPLLKAVVDVYDALAYAVRQVERQKDKILAGLDAILDAADIEVPPEVPVPTSGPRPGFWKRLAGASDPTAPSHAMTAWRERVVGKIAERERQVLEANDFLRQALDGLLTGYTMSLNRIDRVLPQFGMDPMACTGERFDPELMEVVDVVANSGRPSGEVLEEVRRGYIWKEAIFRYAQVKVAK